MCVIEIVSLCFEGENQESAEGGKLPGPRSQSLGTGVASLNINSINSLVSSNSCILGNVAGNPNSLLLLCFLNLFPPTD